VSSTNYTLINARYNKKASLIKEFVMVGLGSIVQVVRCLLDPKVEYIAPGAKLKLKGWVIDRSSFPIIS
jgi:hypothetical protein